MSRTSIVVALFALLSMIIPAARGQQGNPAATPPDGPPKFLPQGLTCGLSYLDMTSIPIIGAPSGPTIDAPCNGAHSAALSYSCILPGVGCGAQLFRPVAAPGYRNVFDGDWSNDTGRGWVHQTYDYGVTDLLQSANFVLPKGAACGFHHTLFSPGETCMGFHPEQAFLFLTAIVKGCPDGWTPRIAGDAGSPNGFWAWCEYDDPNHLSIGGPIVQATGVACGIAHNAAGEDKGPTCMGYRPVEAQSVPAGLPPVGCPQPGMFGLGWIDFGRSSGIGLGYCDMTSDVIPPPAPSRGFLDTTYTQSGTFSGWAFDPMAPETPIYVDLYVDGPAGSGAPGFRVLASAPRQDVNDYFGLRGSNSHGFSFTLPAQYLSSGHTVYAYGISLFGQTNPLLAQSPGTYSPPPPPPPDPPPPPTCRNCFVP